MFCLGMTKADQTPGGEALVGLEESLYLGELGRRAVEALKAGLVG